jgi:hypothetical protein
VRVLATSFDRSASLAPLVSIIDRLDALFVLYRVHISLFDWTNKRAAFGPCPSSSRCVHCTLGHKRFVGKRGLCWRALKLRIISRKVTTLRGCGGSNP